MVGDGFRPTGQHDLAPSGALAKTRANLAALRALRQLQTEGRAATDAEQVTLARWAGWGAVPEVFDEANPRFTSVRAELRPLLSEKEWAAARRTTINAHYTSAEVVQAIWSVVQDLGFAGGRVLEPGCGSGNFIGFAPQGCVITGIELDPVTAGIAAALYPAATIVSESFADTVLVDGEMDLVVGNVPFGKITLHDRSHNAGGHSIHNHFIIKSLDLTRPGGLLAVVTSRFTLDAQNDAARRDMAERADLLGAVRLPAGTFRAASGTDVVTDVVILRRRLPGQAHSGESWLHLAPVATVDGEVVINEYFAAHPEKILGELRRVNGQYGVDDLDVVADPAKSIAPALASITTSAKAAGLTFQPKSEDAQQREHSGVGTREQIPEHVTVRKEGSIVTTRRGNVRPCAKRPAGTL